MDLPSEEKEIMKYVGQTIETNQDLGPPELIQLFAKHFGYAADKEEKKAKIQTAMESACAEPNNAPLLMAFQELAEIYFKQGNANAGAAYSKVVKALKDLRKLHPIIHGSCFMCIPL